MVNVHSLRNKYYLFLITMFIAFINPITFLLMGASWTFTFAVLLTYIIWIYIKWDDFLSIKSKGSRYEILLGTALITGNIVRNLINPNSMSFGIFDMLIMLVGVYISFFGLKATKFFTPLIMYTVVLILGYQLEFYLEQVKTLQNFLAQLMDSLLRSLNIASWVAGDIVTFVDRSGFNTYNLQIDAPCTGIKGMLAYGSLAALLVLDTKSSIRKKAIALSVGLIGTFMVNLLRLSTIFLSVYFLGIDAGLLLHTYLGYVLFTIWVVLFWSLAFKYMTPSIPKKSP